MSAATVTSAAAIPGATALAIRQVYETNEALLGTVAKDPGSPPSVTQTSADRSRSLSASTSSASAAPETTPSAAELSAYANLDCAIAANRVRTAAQDQPGKFLVTCGNPESPGVYYKYLLNPSVIEGRDISNASAQLDWQTETQWGVVLTFKPAAANRWASFTAAHIGTPTAIVLDGNVYSVETIQGAIAGPTAITGNFTKNTASDLARALMRARP